MPLPAGQGISRYWIERAFEDGKGIAVSSQITRSVVGPDGTTIWRYLCLHLLTLLMMVTDLGKKAELLTVQDVKEILLGNAAKKGDYGNGNPENHRRKA